MPLSEWQPSPAEFADHLADLERISGELSAWAVSCAFLSGDQAAQLGDRLEAVETAAAKVRATYQRCNQEAAARQAH